MPDAPTCTTCGKTHKSGRGYFATHAEWQTWLERKSAATKRQHAARAADPTPTVPATDARCFKGCDRPRISGHAVCQACHDPDRCHRDSCVARRIAKTAKLKPTAGKRWQRAERLIRERGPITSGQLALELEIDPRATFQVMKHVRGSYFDRETKRWGIRDAEPDADGVSIAPPAAEALAAGSMTTRAV